MPPSTFGKDARRQTPQVAPIDLLGRHPQLLGESRRVAQGQSAGKSGVDFSPSGTGQGSPRGGGGHLRPDAWRPHSAVERPLDRSISVHVDWARINRGDPPADMFASLPIVRAERLIERTERRRSAVSDKLAAKHRARWGQFFTPAPVADFLASLIELPASGRLVLLDPGAGTGSLTAAVVARAILARATCELHCVAFEADEALHTPLARTLADCERTAAAEGMEVTTELRSEDFVAWASAAASGSIWVERETFGACIMNPPYRKVNNGAAERLAVERLGLRVTNLYPAFMGLAAELLEPGGQLSTITPRSFVNGPYFRSFREFFLARMTLDRLHVYEKRGSLFADADVLQENVVMRAIRDGARDTVTLSASAGPADAPVVRAVPYGQVLRSDDPDLFVHIPIDEAATRITVRITSLPSTLADVGVQVSTGRVVDFRTRENLVHEPQQGCAPLIYPTHLKVGRVAWPQLDGRRPNALAINDATADLLFPIGHYTLVKRFTAKEERRRVVATPFVPGDVNEEVVAFENHLNVFHRNGEGIEPELAFGLAVYLGTTVVDAYVRQFSGHTQINATDLRRLRYPARDELTSIGRAVMNCGWPENQEAVDVLAASHVGALTDQQSLAA